MENRTILDQLAKYKSKEFTKYLDSCVLNYCLTGKWEPYEK